MNFYQANVVDSWMTYRGEWYETQKTPTILYPEGVKWNGYQDKVVDLTRFKYIHKQETIAQAISECTFPFLDYLLDDLDIYITSFPSALHVNAAADGKAIVFYGRGTQIPKAMTHYIAIHELGHVLDYRFTRYKNSPVFYNQYRELRGWGKDKEGNWLPERRGLPWHEMVTEWFAEDFRYLFGGMFANQEYWGVACDPPSSIIRDFMIHIAESTIKSEAKENA